ncbi:MAG: hypothetical protein K2W95_14565 [Candidatus Obscuribacterales bacterium]|nr:hypothetical protein [Candidatus Obscuribacterales bacterium]
MQLDNPRCAATQEAFLAHHNVELYNDGDRFGWGLAWKHGFMGMISLKPDRSEACGIAALFVHWWLEGGSGLDPGELERAAWFFFNTDKLPAAKEKHTDEDSVKQFAFVEQQLARYAHCE